MVRRFDALQSHPDCSGCFDVLTRLQSYECCLFFWGVSTLGLDLPPSLKSTHEQSKGEGEEMEASSNHASSSPHNELSGCRCKQDLTCEMGMTSKLGFHPFRRKNHKHFASRRFVSSFKIPFWHRHSLLFFASFKGFCSPPFATSAHARAVPGPGPCQCS